MSTADRRRADRVEVGIPVQLYTKAGFVDAEVRDLSRTGLRMRCSIKKLGFRAETLQQAAKGIAGTLTPYFAVDLHYERLGPLLQRRVGLTRIGLANDAPGFIELCCVFDEPVSDDETAVLETPLPPIKEDMAQWCPDEDVPKSCEGVVTFQPEPEPPVKLPRRKRKRDPSALDLPPQRYRALVSGTHDKAPPAFFCHTDMVTAIGLRVRVPRERFQSMQSVLVDLQERYGSKIDVRLVESGETIWRGDTRPAGVEFPPDRTDLMYVTLAYNKPLETEALKRLELVRAA